jgi:hypothetical protein
MVCKILKALSTVSLPFRRSASQSESPVNNSLILAAQASAFSFAGQG